MKRLPVIVCGANGRVGKDLLAQIEASQDLQLAGACTRELPLSEVATRVSPEQRAVVIDFSLPDALIEHAKVAEQFRLPLVVGVSGVDEQKKAFLVKVSAKIPVLIAPNTSIAANLLAVLSAQAARVLEAADVEICETHHRHKKDSPSGTAHFLVDEIAKARHIPFAQAACFNRHEAGPRKQGEIGVVGLRGGDVAGTHIVHLFDDGETLELTHRVTDRRVFARGALIAARFLATQPAGLYSMLDVFKLSAFGETLND